MLNRSIGRWAMVLLFINGVIGSGIFGLPSKAFKEVGVYSIVAFVVCALAVFVIMLCFAEVSSRFNKTGGPTCMHCLRLVLCLLFLRDGFCLLQDLSLMLL
jgi:amino acid transporter